MTAEIIPGRLTDVTSTVEITSAGLAGPIPTVRDAPVGFAEPFSTVAFDTTCRELGGLCGQKAVTSARPR